MAFNPPLVDNEIPSTAKWNSAVAVYDRVVSSLDVVNTTTETAIYSKSIEAGHMSSDRMLRLTLLGDYLNNSGGSRTLRVKVKFGASTLFDDITDSIQPSSGRRPFAVYLQLGNRTASSQRLGGAIVIGSSDAATAGLGDLQALWYTAANFASTAQMIAPISGTGAVATASAQTLEVTVTHGAAHASLSLVRDFAMLELA